MHFPEERVHGFPQLLTEAPDRQTVWIGATSHWSCHAPPPPCCASTAVVLLPPCSPWGRGAHTHGGGHTHPGGLSVVSSHLLALAGVLSAVLLCPSLNPCAPQHGALGPQGNTSPILCVMFHPPPSPLCVSTPVGSVDLWGQGTWASLNECKRTAAQRAFERAPSFPVIKPGSALVSCPLGRSPILFCFSSS